MEQEDYKVKEGSFTIDNLADEMYEADVDDGDSDEAAIVDGEQYDNSSFIFGQHEGSVFVVDVSKDGRLAVSGGEDDKAFLWKVESGEVVYEFKFQDSVTCAIFSSNSKFLAVGDMSGVIKVLNTDTKKLVWDFQTADLEWLDWHPVAPVLMAGTSDGDAWLWKIPGGESKIFPSPGCPCMCGKILPDGKAAVLAYADGSIRVFDLKTQALVHTLKKDAHRAPVNHLTCSVDGQILVTGASDGITLLTTISTGKVFAVYKDGDRTDHESTDFSIENVGYSDNLSFAAAASLDNYLYVWDTKSGNLRAKCEHPDGLTRLSWDSKGLHIFTGCLDGICRQWSARTGELISTFVGHTDQILDLQLSKNDALLISASSDGTCRVFDICDVSQSS